MNPLMRALAGSVFCTWAVFWGVAFVSTRHPLACLLSVLCVALAWLALEDEAW